MKKQPKPPVRTRVDSISLSVRWMKYESQLNGLTAAVRREGDGADKIRTYKHVTDASVKRIVRVGRAIAGKVKA